MLSFPVMSLLKLTYKFLGFKASVQRCSHPCSAFFFLRFESSSFRGAEGIPHNPQKTHIHALLWIGWSAQSISRGFAAFAVLACQTLTKILIHGTLAPMVQILFLLFASHKKPNGNVTCGPHYLCVTERLWTAFSMSSCHSFWHWQLKWVILRDALRLYLDQGFG